MTALVNVPVYRKQPRDISVTLGAGATVSRSLPMVVSTSDFGVGFNNVADMKVWGDLDAGFDAHLHGATEENSHWYRYKNPSPLVLSVGDGVKVVYVKVRNSSGAESDVYEASILLQASIPHPSVLWTDVGPSPSIVDGVVQFGWSASHDFTEAAVCLASNAEAPYEQCDVELLSFSPGAAGEEQYVHFYVADDILPNDPYPTQDGHKMLKIFIQVGGKWYGAINGR